MRSPPFLGAAPQSHPFAMPTLRLASLDSLPAAASAFAAQIGSRRIFAFYGAMGAGKTTFIRALCHALGSTDEVNSPTFAIVNEYRADKPFERICHFDFYRINKVSEVYDMGYEDYFYGGSLCLIEWPELIEDLLPDDCVRVRIEEQPDGTRLVSF